MLIFDTSKLTPVERAALDMKRQSAQSAPEAEPPTVEEFLQMHADHLLEMAVKEYLTGQLPLLEVKALQFLNCTPDQQAKIDEILQAASPKAMDEPLAGS